MTAEINYSTESYVRGKCTLFILIYKPPLCRNVGPGTNPTVKKTEKLKAWEYSNLKNNSHKDTYTQTP